MKRLSCIHINRSYLSTIKSSSSSSSSTSYGHKKFNRYLKPTKFSSLFQQLSKEEWSVGTQRKLHKIQNTVGNNHNSWKEILKTLGKDANTKPSILLHFLRHMRKIGIQIDAEDSNNLLESCITLKDSNFAYDFLMNSINNSNSNLHIQMDASNTSIFKLDEKFIVNEDSFKLTLIACGVSGDTDNITRVFDHLRSSGGKINLGMWNTLLNAYAQKQDANNAMVTMERMILSGIAPDISSYNRVLKACCNNYNQAKIVFEKIKEKKLMPDNYSYSALIKAALSSGKASGLPQAIAILEESIHRNSKMQVTSLSTSFLFNPIMTECVKQQQYDTLDALYTALERLKIQPDLHTYTIMLTAASDMGDKKWLMDTLDDLLQDKELKSISHVCWRVLSSLYGRSSDASGLVEILDTIRKSRKEFISLPMWRDLIGLYGRNGNSIAAEKALHEMVQLDGIHPDQSCFIRVIRSYASTGNYKKAHQMVKNMRSKNVDVDSDVWGYILSSCAKHHEDVSELFELLQEFILIDGYVPHASIWTLIVNSYVSRQKLSENTQTKEMRISIELDLISSFLIYCPYSQIRTIFIKKIIQEILEKNIHVNGANDEVNVAEIFLLGIAKEVNEKNSVASIKDELMEGFKEIFLYLSNNQKLMNNDKITLLIKNMIEGGIIPSNDMMTMYGQIEVKKFLIGGQLEEAEKCAINSIKVFGDNESDKDVIQHYIESVKLPIFQYYLKNRHYRKAEKLLTALHVDTHLNHLNSTPFYGSLINEVIKEACASNSYDTALKIVEQYHQQGSGNGVNLWNVLLYYASENNKPDEAIFFLDRMRSLNIPTNTSVWSSLISSLCFSMRINEALDSLHDMLIFDGVTPTADMCNPIFKALSEQDNYIRTQEAINIMIKNNISPTIVHYDAVIKSYVQSNSKYNNRPITYILNDLFNEMERHKIIPNIDIYKWLISHYADKDDTNSIIMIIQYMIKNNIAITEDIMKIMEHIKRFDQVLELVESYSHNQ